MKKLSRSSKDKKIAGVCAGIADYYEVDPTLVRAGYAFVTILTGIVPGILAYIVMVWIMPNGKKA